MIFTKAIKVKGNLHSSYCFQTEQDREQWKKEDLPILEKEHGSLEVYEYNLDGLKVGDRCHVVGEGHDIFTIVDIVNYSKNRYGFVLDSGWREEINKCYKV